MRRTRLLLAACVCILCLVIPRLGRTPGVPSVHRQTIKRVALSPETIAQHNRLRKLQVTRQMKRKASAFQVACDAFLGSNQTLADLERLLKAGRHYRGSVNAIALCDYSVEITRELLAESLAERIQEGDWEASRVAYALAGAECMESPQDIQISCADRAQEDEWSAKQWRDCLALGNESYRTCAQDVMRDYGVDHAQATERYVSEAPSQAMKILTEARGGKRDLEDAIDELEERTRDPFLVEILSTHFADGIFLQELFLLTQDVKRTGNPATQSQADALLSFWGKRYDFESAAQEQNASPPAHFRPFF